MSDTGPVSSLVGLRVEVPPGVTIGSKAAGLARLARAGLPVPDGLVIPAETSDQDIDELAAEIAAAMSGRTLAVRSSGVAEDLAHSSYAGQYDTVLGVAAEPGPVAAAVRRVRSSASAARVASYSGSHATAMAVLVMPMVAADSAGIAFTRNPVTGSDVVIVEAVRGLGDHLAAGESVGERWRVGPDVVRENNLGVLTSEDARAIADLAIQCRKATGEHQDIEWAITDGGVILLQARPITAVDDVEPISMDEQPPPGPWEWDSTHNRLPISPLTSSILPGMFAGASRRLAETYGAPIKQLSMTTINGYVYIQVVPPAGKPGASFPPKPIMRILFSVVPLLRQRRKAARIAAETRVDQTLLEQWNTETGPETEETLARWNGMDRSSLSTEALAKLMIDAVELQGQTFSWNMATDPAYLFPLSELAQFVDDELGRGMETTIRLLAGSSPSAYHRSVADLRDRLGPAERETIAQGMTSGLESLGGDFADAYEAHLANHGLRILGFDLRHETLLERPDLELSRIATLPPHTDPSIEAERFADDLRSSLTDRAMARFDALVAEARRTYPIREAGEAVHAKTVGMIRLIALEAGFRIVSEGDMELPEHVMFLTLDEITGWLSEPTDVRELVRTRRGQDLWARGQSPESFYGDTAPMPEIDLFPPEVQRIMKAITLITTHDQLPANLAEGVDGVGASPGVHTGTVRIVYGPDDFEKVQPGDVLVAPITTSPWEVLFPHVGALVTEGGGLLSHPAIVAREYGLPAVVGCEGAMGRFHDGQLVRVDGVAGTVTPIEA